MVRVLVDAPGSRGRKDGMSLPVTPGEGPREALEPSLVG